MTSQSSTINERITKRAGFSAFFGFGLRRFWTTMLLFFIILFFVLPVPVLMIISERSLDNMDVFISVRKMFATEWATTMRMALIPILSAFAVVASCSRFKYLKNKAAVDFYHSLPIKRGRLFANQLVISALAIIIPLAAALILTLVFIASNGLITGTLIVNLLLSVGEALVYAFFIYALTTLVGMVCGMTSVQVTLTAVALAIVPATWLLGLLFFEIFSENMWFDYYLAEDSAKYMSPVLRYALDTEPLDAVETVISILITALMLGGAYLLYRSRKSERAGTPVVFAPLGEVIKYAVMVVGTLLGGIFFYNVMNYDFVWTIFGMICGMVLVFMLSNTILQKTAKAMFKGWRGLIVFAGVTALTMVVLMTNLFGINSYIPSPSNTTKTVVQIDYGSTYEFSDPDNIAAIHKIYSEGEWSYDYVAAKGGNISYDYDTIGIRVAFYPKFGAPVAKEVRIYNKSDFIEEFRVILDSDEFEEQYTGRIADIRGNGYARVDLPYYRVNPEDGTLWRYYLDNGWWFESFNYTAAQAKDFALREIIEANSKVDFEHFQRQSIGELYIDGYMSYNFSRTLNFPIYASMDNVTRRFVENGFLTLMPEENINAYAEMIDGITLYYAPDGVTEAKSHTFKQKDEIRALLMASANIHGETSACEFTFVDTAFEGYYTVEVLYGDYEAYGAKYYTVDEYGNEVLTEEVDGMERVVATTAESFVNEVSEREFQIAFLLGRVPDFVYEAFGIEK